MAKFGRNVPCPCGSGKKYKYCCGSTGKTTKKSEQPESKSAIPSHISNFEEYFAYRGLPFKLAPSNIFIDKKNKLISVEPAREELLLIRLEQTTLKNVEEFDKNYLSEFHNISAEYSELEKAWSKVMSDIMNRGESNTWNYALASLFNYTLDTLTASVDLLRRGYREQVAILCRDIIEGSASAIWLTVDPDAQKNLKAGNFDSPKAITKAKNFFPLFGILYGDLSKYFTHLNKAHLEWRSLKGKYDHNVTEDCILLVKYAILCTRMAFELAFYPYFDTAKFWSELGEAKYETSISQETKKWVKNFLGSEIPGI